MVASKIVLPTEGSMTIGSIPEYTEAVRGRYLGASKKENRRECGNNNSEDCCVRSALEANRATNWCM